MQSSPTRSTGRGDSHRGPCECRWRQVQAGDGEVDAWNFSSGSASYVCGRGSSSFSSGWASTTRSGTAHQQVQLGCEVVGVGKRTELVPGVYFIGARHDHML
jgi:hypothetical protein